MALINTGSITYLEKVFYKSLVFLVLSFQLCQASRIEVIPTTNQGNFIAFNIADISQPNSITNKIDEALSSKFDVKKN